MLMPRSLSRLSSKILRNSYFHGAGHKSVGSIFNQMKSRVLITIITLLFFLPAAFAQKRLIIETEKIIKSGKNLEKAEQNMRNLLRDSANRKNIKVWATLTDAMRGQYLASNENIYLQNRQDTAKLFLLARRMFLDYQGLDTIDATPDKKGRVRPSYRKSNAQFLDTYRPNLYNGGIYFIRKNNLQQAYTMLESYLDCLRQPLFSNMNYAADTLNYTAAFWTVFCGYHLGNREMTLRYKDLALRDTARLENTLQYLAETYKAMNDTASYEQSLRMGFQCNRQSPYFFPRIVDLYNQTLHPDSAMAIVDQALAANDTLELFLYAKSNLLLNRGDYDACIALCDTMIARNDSMADAYYNAGVAYLNKVFLIEKGKVGPKQRKEMQKLYRKALPYMERYRALEPKETEKWAAALYNIYLKLNMGREFEEIDRMLR